MRNEFASRALGSMPVMARTPTTTYAVAASHRRIRKIFKITVAVLSLPRRFAQGNLEPYVERAEIALGASLNLIGNSDQVCVLSLSPFLHWASNFAYCSGVRIDFAASMYLASLASVQPAL
jgi:hypothetical protein